MQFLLRQSALLKSRGAFPKKGGPNPGMWPMAGHPPKPFPNHPRPLPHPRCSSVRAPHSAPQLAAQMWRYGRCHVQKPRGHFVLVRRREGSWGYCSAAGQGVHHILPRRVPHQGENEQMLGASFSASVSQGAFKDQPLSLLGASHRLPPPLEVWSLLASQNTACVAITYMATGRAGEVGSESSFSPEEVQHGDSVFPPFRDSWYMGTQERTSGHRIGQAHGWSWPIFCSWGTSLSSLQTLTPDCDIFSIPPPFALPSRASSLRSCVKSLR